MLKGSQLVQHPPRSIEGIVMCILRLDYSITVPSQKPIELHIERGHCMVTLSTKNLIIRSDRRLLPLQRKILSVPGEQETVKIILALTLDLASILILCRTGSILPTVTEYFVTLPTQANCVPACRSCNSLKQSWNQLNYAARCGGE
jgi:hypothetical protein